MGSFQSARGYYGLECVGTPAATNVTGPVTVGVQNSTVAITGANVAYSLRAIFAGNADALVLDLTENDTTGSTTWVAGTAQVETATAAGTISGSGNAEVIVTASGMTGSPKTINVAVVNGDTAATWAGKVRTALAADADVSALFDVGGTTTAITLTRKATTTYTVGSTSVPIYPANDGTLNISLDNGTCTGITTAATSANTTAGVASDGVQIFDGDGNDFEGVDVATIATIAGVLIVNSGTSAVNVAGGTDDVYTVNDNEVVLRASTDAGPVGTDSTLTFTATGTTNLTVTVIGLTA